MAENNAMTHAVHVHNSPTAYYSIGPRVEYLRDSQVFLETLQLNRLLKRVNKPNSQANVYLKGGFGLAHKNSLFRPAAWAGLDTDWESRRFYGAYSNRFLTASDLTDLVNQRVRLGVTPYVAEHGKVHTWFVVQVDHNPTQPEELIVTPIVRLFKGATLLEAGVSTTGKVLFNVTRRF